MKNRKWMKSAVICTAMLLSALLCGCAANSKGSTNSSDGSIATETTPKEVKQVTEGRVYAKDMDLDKYISLKDYQSFRVARDEIVVNEEELQAILDNVYLNSFPEKLGVKDRAVAVGDTANIDYVGTLNGVAFDGGTANGAKLTIGSHTYIDGFEDGLVGVMPGETVDLNLTFPENYHNADLAGQAVVFTVTVNYIIPAEKMDEAIAGLIAEVNTIEELHQYIYDYLYDTAMQEGQESYEEQIMDAFLEEICDIKELPSEWTTYYSEQARNYFVTTALQQATDPETLVKTYYGMDLETFLTTYSELAAKRDLAMQALAKKEGLTIQTDEELDKLLEQYSTEAGCETIADYLGEASKEDFRQDYVYEQAFSFIIDLAGKE